MKRNQMVEFGSMNRCFSLKTSRAIRFLCLKKGFYKSIILLGFAVASFDCFGADGWQPFYSINDDYFEVPAAPRIVLVMSGPIGTCASQTWGHIEQSVVGTELFRAYAAVVVTAIAMRRSVSVSTSGCTGDRAIITGIKLSAQ